MSKVLVTESYLSATGNAIRSKAGTYSTYKPSQFASAILSIPTVQDLSIGSKTISENGTYLPSSDSLDYYSQVTVSVSGVVPSGSISISENGSYDVTDYASAVVDVAAPSVSGSIGISENGTYNVASYADAVVDVPGVVPSGSLSISQNGAYDVASYASAVVSVEGGGVIGEIVSRWLNPYFVSANGMCVERYSCESDITYAFQCSKWSGGYEGITFKVDTEPGVIYEMCGVVSQKGTKSYGNWPLGVAFDSISREYSFYTSTRESYLAVMFSKPIEEQFFSFSYNAFVSEAYFTILGNGLVDNDYYEQVLAFSGIQLYKVGTFSINEQLTKTLMFPDDPIAIFDLSVSLYNTISYGRSLSALMYGSYSLTENGLVFTSDNAVVGISKFSPPSRYFTEIDIGDYEPPIVTGSDYKQVINVGSGCGIFYRSDAWQAYTKNGWEYPDFSQESADYFANCTIGVMYSGGASITEFTIYKNGVSHGTYSISISMSAASPGIGRNGNHAAIQGMQIKAIRVYDGFHSYSSGTLDSISVATMPSKTSYIEGEVLDLTGVGINATYTDSTVVDVTSMCTFDPADGDTLADGGTQPVVVEYTDGGITCSTSFNVTVDDTWRLIEGTSISAEAYWGDGGIQKVYGPDVITIGSRAFSKDTSLYMASFPVATTIESSAFHKCGRNALSGFTVSMPEVVTINGYGAFEQADLHSIELPKAEYIGYATFRSCRFLSQVSLPLVSFVDAWGFTDCSALQTLELPQLISTGTGAFQNCSALSQVSCPIAEIFGDMAFASCSNLETVRFSALSKIGYAMFSNCIKLSGLYLLGSSVAGFDIAAQYVSQAFYNTPMYDSTLTGAYGSIYVPSSLETSFKTAQGWSDLAGRIVGI